MPVSQLLFLQVAPAPPHEVAVHVASQVQVRASQSTSHGMLEGQSTEVFPENMQVPVALQVPPAPPQLLSLHAGASTTTQNPPAQVRPISQSASDEHAKSAVLRLTRQLA